MAHKKDEDIETLRKALAKANARAQKAEAESKKLESENKSLEIKNKTLVTQNEALTNKIEELRIELMAHKVALDGVAEMYLGTQKERLDQRKDIAQAQLDLLIEDLEALRDASKTFGSALHLVKYLMKKGSEKSSSLFDKKESKNLQAEVEKSVKKRFSTAEQSAKEETNVLNPLRKGAEIAAQQLDENSQDAIVIACAEISSHAEPESAPKMNREKMMGGRQVPQMQKDAPVVDAIENTMATCPKCKCTMELAGHWQNKVRTLAAQLNRLIEFDSKECNVYVCPKCGRAHAVIPENVQTPVTPSNGRISQRLLISIATLQAHGIPVNRTQTLLTSDGRDYQIGNDTLQYDLKYWVEKAAGSRMFAEIEKEARKCEVLIMDETPFDILQQAGKSQKTIEAPSKQAYIEAITSGPLEPHPLTLFYRLDSRSAESIKKVAEGFHPEVVITDGYKAYPSVLKAMGASAAKSITHQVCVAHWRRTLLEAFNIKELSAVMLKPDGAEIAGRRIAKHQPEYLACVMIDALRKVYGYEAELKRKNEDSESPSVRIERIEKSRKEHAVPLFDQIDLIVKELAKTHAEEKNGQWIKKGDNAISPALVYYLNNREAIRAFLTDGRIAPDSNACERAIRPIVLYKQAARFKQAPDYTEGLCRWQTIIETGKRCGIKNLELWLWKFGEAFFRYCFDETLTSNVDKDTRELRSTHVSAFTEESKESFDMTPWLPWNYAKTEGQPVPAPVAAAKAETPEQPKP